MLCTCFLWWCFQCRPTRLQATSPAHLLLCFQRLKGLLVCVRLAYMRTHSAYVIAAVLAGFERHT